MGAFALAFTMILGTVQLPAKAEGESDVIAKGENLTLPAADNGGTVRFCADYEQIIGEDGTVYTPLEDKTVTGFFEKKTGNTVTKEAEKTYTVKGEYEADSNANPKPAVIPELQEWHGKTGDFYTASFSRIIIGSTDLQDTAEAFAQDYKDITGLSIKVISGNKNDARAGDFYMSLTANKGLGNEGYAMDIDDITVVEAESSTGAYWATRTVLQILKQKNGSIPKGLVRDYPKYEVRAFSLDVGRKPFSMDALYQFAKNMAWYKLNSFQVHLSDNLIFMEDYKVLEGGDEDKGLERAKKETYAGFRLESGVLNTDEEYLEGINRLDLLNKSATSKDLYYTKDEFRTFIQDSRIIGVDIVPELDMPAHALPFTMAFPQYRTKVEKGGQHAYVIDELDLDNPETTEWAQSIWSDYFTGNDPVFDEDTTIHIGTDEFHGTGGNESFRKFSDDMIAFVQSTGRKVRMWGSLSNKGGTTPVRSENVQLNVWETGYANPQVMYNQGFDIINTSVAEGLYIVPSGTGVRGTSYADYLDPAHIYNNWAPNKFNNMNYTIPAGDDQMLGGCFAVWHDNIDTRANGISQIDSFDRFLEALSYMSAKLWGDARDRGYDEFTRLAGETGTAPNTNMYAEVDFMTNTVAEWNFDDTMNKDSSLNQFDLTGSKNASLIDTNAGQKALQLNGGESYAETPLDHVGENAVIKMKVKLDANADTENSEQILCESKEAFGQEIGTYAIKASMKQTGKVGFSREGYDYSFDYALPKDNTWVELEFHSGQDMVALYVNGELADNDPKIYYSNHETMELSASITAKRTKKIATMMVPIGRIGSNTDSFKGQIEYVTITGSKQIKTEKVPHSEMTAASCSAASGAPAQNAIDDNETSIWHTNWASGDGQDVSLTTEHPYHWFEVTLNTPTLIETLTYLPQTGANGRIYEYSIVITDENGQETTVLDHKTWADNTDLKTASFAPTKAKKVKLLIHDAGKDTAGIHGTIAELNLYQAADRTKAKEALSASLNELSKYDKNNYADISWNAYMKAKEEAEQILNYSGSTEDDYLYANEKLQAAEENLTALSEAYKSTYSRYQLMSTIEEAEEKLAVLEDAKAKQTLQAFIVKAKDALENPDLGQEDLSEINSTLENMTNDTEEILVLVAKDELTAVIADAKKKLSNTAGYTADSVKKLRDAISAAENLLAKSGVTVKELETASENLNKMSLAKEPPKTDTGLKDNASFEADGIKYQVVSASGLTAKLVKGKDAAKLTIDTVSYGGKTYQIVEIGNNAFSGCKKKLKKVTIGPNVAVIGKNAFKGCKKLTNVVVKNNSKLSKVGGGAFKKASSKIKIKLPKNLKKNKKLKNQLKKAGIKKGL